MVGRIITSNICVSEGADWLGVKEPIFKYAIEKIDEIPLRLRRDGFVALLDAIVSQQISVAAARGIWSRMEAANLCSSTNILNATDDDLKNAGLSRSKVKYARALAESELNFEDLRVLPNEQVTEKLIEIKGIGRWTAEIYCMFALGRADAFAAGDLALQESAKVLFELEKRPSEAELRQMAENWSPWKSVAARILFAYYRVIKNREGLK